MNGSEFLRSFSDSSRNLNSLLDPRFSTSSLPSFAGFLAQEFPPFLLPGTRTHPWMHPWSDAESGKASKRPEYSRVVLWRSEYCCGSGFGWARLSIFVCVCVRLFEKLMMQNNIDKNWYFVPFRFHPNQRVKIAVLLRHDRRLGSDIVLSRDEGNFPWRGYSPLRGGIRTRIRHSKQRGNGAGLMGMGSGTFRKAPKNVTDRSVSKILLVFLEALVSKDLICHNRRQGLSDIY